MLQCMCLKEDTTLHVNFLFQHPISISQYWPDLYETMDFGMLQCTCLKEEISSAFAFREFTLTSLETNEERVIHQMQYIAWPDHGVPNDAADFLQFIFRVCTLLLYTVQYTL